VSKFEYASFYGGWEDFAVNAEKYTKQEAIEVFERECEPDKVGKEIGQYEVLEMYVKWRAGINDDGEPCAGWWLESYKRKKGSCPVWAFSKKTKGEVE